MELITWSERYAVHIAEIDQQHRKLISLLNQLDDAMTEGKGTSVLGAVLAELVEYTLYHFSTEERLFERHSYPGAADHKKEHGDFTARVRKLKQDFDGGNWMLTIDVLKVLTTWLNNHILGTDKKYEPFLKGKGVS